MAIDNTFTAFFLDTTTAPGTPLTGLSATITIVDVENNAIVVNDVAMTEVGAGFYKYVYSEYQPTRSYNWLCDPNSALAYITSGTTALPEGPARGGGGGNLGATNERINILDKKLNKIYEELTKKEEPQPKEEIDFTPILNKIDSIEIPETKLEEKEAKKALKLIEKLDKKFTEYVESEMSDKEELGAIAREFTKLEMEQQAKHMKHMEEMRKKEEEDKKKEEEERKKEEEQDKMLLEEIKAEFDKIEEEDKEEKKKEIEMELKELEKEMKEKEKELKSL